MAQNEKRKKRKKRKVFVVCDSDLLLLQSMRGRRETKDHVEKMGLKGERWEEKKNRDFEVKGWIVKEMNSSHGE